MKGLIKVVTAAAGVLAGGELTHLVVSRLAYRPRPVDGPTSVLVLGFGSKNRALSRWLNRWRAEIAVRSVPPDEMADARFVPSGWSFGHSEAALLAEFLMELGVPAEQIVLEEQAMTTRQNLRYGIPLIHDDGPLLIASNPLHALRARHYLWTFDPDTAGRLRPSADYRPGEYLLLRPVLAAYDTYGALGSAVRPRVRSWLGRTTTPSR